MSDRLAAIDTHLTLLTWMVGINLGAAVVTDWPATITACLRADLKQFERRRLIRWCAMLAACFGGLFAELHLWPPHG